MIGVLQDPYILLGAPNRLHQSRFLFSLQGSYPTNLTQKVGEAAAQAALAAACWELPTGRLPPDAVLRN